MKLLGLGDNTVDIYVDKGVQFPGGNAVNVAVFAKRLGFDASYLGCVGNDERAEVVERALRAEGVDVSHIRHLDEPNSWARIRHNGNDRVFDSSHRISLTKYNLDDDDFEFIAEHDHCHSSVYSGLEGELPGIRGAARRLSFDFSDVSTTDYIAQVAPYIDVAFLSGAKLDLSECEDVIALLKSCGCPSAIITRGAEGALGSHCGEWFFSKPAAGVITDTLGAGDGFIAGFLVADCSGVAFPKSLLLATENAAAVCAEEGAFGHGVRISEGQIPSRHGSSA